MNKLKILKWLFWVVIASILLFGGLAIVLSTDYSRTTRIMGKFAMWIGMMVWGTVVVVFVSKKLK